MEPLRAGHFARSRTSQQQARLSLGPDDEGRGCFRPKLNTAGDQEGGRLILACQFC